MRKIVSYAIKKRRLTVFFMIAAILFGAYSYYLMPRQETPDISAPAAQIRIFYPGASPEKVEEEVTEKLEDVMKDVPGFKTSETYTKESLSVGILMLEDGIDPEPSWDRLRVLMDDLEQELPDGIHSIAINTDIAETAGMIISMSGQGYSTEELADYADDVADQLSKIDGITRFDIVGDLEKNIEIAIDMERLNQYALSLEDVANMIKVQNVEIPSGKLDTGASRLTVQAEGVYSSLEDIRNTILLTSPQTGNTLRLRDIATVEMAVDDGTPRYYQDQSEAVLLAGYFTETLNVVHVGEEVEAALDVIQADLPKGINFHLAVYSPHDVEASINDFIMNLVQAVVFVILTVLIGMGMRNAVVVSTTIPLAIAMTFVAMYLLGIKLEQMSISALIIALGMLVDNAIVVSDSIQHYLDEGLDKLQACIKGTAEVATSILTSTATTVFSFLPLLLLDSAAGTFMFGVPSVVILALIASYVCALVSTPLMAYLLFKPSAPNKKEKFGRLRQFFDGLFETAMKHKITMALVLIVILAGTGVLAASMPTSMFPKADKNVLYIELRGENPSDLLATDAVMQDAMEILSMIPQVKHTTASVGEGLPKFYVTMRNVARSNDVGQVLVEFDPLEGGAEMTHDQVASTIQVALDELLIGGKASVRLLDIGSIGGAPIEMRLLGDSMEELESLSEELVVILEDIEGTTNVTTDFANRSYQYFIEVDEATAGLAGVSKYDIQKEVRNALSGNAASSYSRGGRSYALQIKSNVDSKERLENIAIKSSTTGEKVPLKNVATIQLKSSYPNITRWDGDRAVKISSDVLPGYSSAAIEEAFVARTAHMDMRGMALTFDGEADMVSDSFADLGKLGLVGLFLIMTVLIIQFNSYLQPAIILVTIPLSFAGALFSLYITGQELSFTAMLGMVSLMGIVVNNAIVLIDYINQARGEGQTALEACKTAVGRRLRPILLSTTTTVIGLVPLVVSGGETFRPMAIGLMGGLLFSTLLTLVFVPSLVAITHGKKEERGQPLELATEPQ